MFKFLSLDQLFAADIKNKRTIGGTEQAVDPVVTNVRRNYIGDDDWAMISLEGHQKNARSEVHTGDVLIARSGVNLGMASAVPEQYDGYNAIDVVIAVPKQELILPRYLAYYTNSLYGISSVKRN